MSQSISESVKQTALPYTPAAPFSSDPMPRGQGVAAVLSYLRTVLNNKDKVRDSLEYLLELSTESRISVDPVSKLLITEAMVNNLTERDVQLAGLGLFNKLVTTGMCRRNKFTMRTTTHSTRWPPRSNKHPVMVSGLWA